MKPRKSFKGAFAESLRLEAPYWLVVLLVLSVGGAIASPALDALIGLFLAWVGIGACIVFVILKKSSSQDASRIDFLGALKNLYQAAWWPWYVWQRLTKSR